jgi:hypothetical protein
LAIFGKSWSIKLKIKKKFCKPAVPLDNDIKMPQKSFVTPALEGFAVGTKEMILFAAKNQKPKLKNLKKVNYKMVSASSSSGLYYKTSQGRY